MSKEKDRAIKLISDIEAKVRAIDLEIEGLNEKIKIIEMLEFTGTLSKLPQLLNFDFEISDKEKIKSEIGALKDQLSDLNKAHSIIKEMYND